LTKTVATLLLLLFSVALIAQDATANLAVDINVTQTDSSDLNTSAVLDTNLSQDDNSSVKVYLKASDTNLTQTDSLLTDSISVEHNGVTYNCSQEDLIAEDVNGTKVYHCATKAEKKIRDNSDARGTAETDRLRQEVKEKTQGEKRVILVENNESNASGKWKPFYYTQEVVEKVIPAKVYLSLRFAELYQNDTFTFTDRATRGGLFYYKEFDNHLEMAFQYEASVKFSNNGNVIGSDTQAGNESTGILLGTRLNYFTMRKDAYAAVIGKYWGVYYDIAGMTDKYMVFGALGNGVYNSGTDGGGSGTGRAANVLQLRIKKDVYNIGLQLQYHPKNFSALYSGVYAYGAAFSLYYKGLDNGLKLGLTANYARLRDIYAPLDANSSDTLASRGVGENDIAVLAGLSYQKDKVSLDFTLGGSKNHITDDEGNSLRGLGSELYVRYRLQEKWRFAFGFNMLFPNKRYYKKEYELRDYIASLQYAFNQEYTRLIYLETKYSAGTNADGSKMSSAAALGFRYLFDY